MSIEIDPYDRSLRADCLRYIRADASDVAGPDGESADPPWDDVVERAEEPVARAWMRTEYFEEYKRNEEEEPLLVDVLDNAICKDWLVYADDSNKIDVIAHLDEAIAECEAQSG
jgi:hypothetical protein